eukprot:scaffold1726_cov260-Pinguiococcus_pyrenoidosus.AAC.38
MQWPSRGHEKPIDDAQKRQEERAKSAQVHGEHTLDRQLTARVSLKTPQTGPQQNRSYQKPSFRVTPWASLLLGCASRICCSCTGVSSANAGSILELRWDRCGDSRASGKHNKNNTTTISNWDERNEEQKRSGTFAKRLCASDAKQGRASAWRPTAIEEELGAQGDSDDGGAEPTLQRGRGRGRRGLGAAAPKPLAAAASGLAKHLRKGRRRQEAAAEREELEEEEHGVSEQLEESRTKAVRSRSKPLVPGLLPATEVRSTAAKQSRKRKKDRGVEAPMDKTPDAAKGKALEGGMAAASDEAAERPPHRKRKKRRSKQKNIRKDTRS